MAQRLTGLPRGSIDPLNHEIHLELAVADGEPLPFVAKFGVASQIASGLSRMVKQLGAIMRSQNAAASTPVERIGEAYIQKEEWEDLVILRFVSVDGTPYTFGVSTAAASEIADRLKAESAKPTVPGHA